MDKLKKLGLKNSYTAYGYPAVYLHFDEKTEKWKVYIGEIDVKGKGIIASKIIELSFEEGVGAIKILREIRMVV